MKLRQRDFGKLFGASNASVSNIENGNYLDLPEHRTLNELATKVLKIEYWELIRLLHQGEEPVLPQNLTASQIIAALELIEDSEDLHDILSAVVRRIDHVRGQ